MTIKVALEHRTTYRFDRPVALGPHIVRLRPAPHARTPVSAYSLRVSPAEHFLNWQQDPYGNYLARLVFPERTTELDVTVDLIADLTVVNPFDFFLEEYAERFPFGYDAALRADLAPYLGHGPDEADVGAVRAWLGDQPALPADGARTVDFLVGLNQQLAARRGLHRADGAGRAERRPRPWPRPSAPAATRPGCWSRSCASSAWRPGSCPAT